MDPRVTVFQHYTTKFNPQLTNQKIRQSQGFRYRKGFRNPNEQYTNTTASVSGQRSTAGVSLGTVGMSNKEGRGRSGSD